MSGQWEIVKSKKDKANGVTEKMTKAEKKKFIENAPKVEDLLPLSQVRTLYSTLDKSQAVKPQVKSQVKPKGKEDEKKKTVSKKPHQNLQEKKKEKPKNFEIAIKQITLVDLQKALEVAKARNNNVPVATVIDIVNHLNDVLQIEVADPIFSNRPVGYPLCAVPKDIHNCFLEMLTWAGKNSYQTLYERLLRDIVYSASRGQPSLGSKIILQLVTQLKPKVALDGIAESSKLKDSYQSNQKCWQSVLWALGQAAFTDLSIGLSVWEKTMLPLMENRNYQRFVINHLGLLVTQHLSSGRRQSLSHNEYLNALDAIYAPPAKTPANLVDELNMHGHTLKALALKWCSPDRLSCFLEPVMERLKSSRSDVYKKELQSFLWEVLKCDRTSIHVWKKLYVNKKNNGKYLAQSASLLRQVGNDLKSSKPVLNVKEVRNVLRSFDEFNKKLLATKPKTEGLRECAAICTKVCKLSDKMASKKKFPWMSVLFVAVLVSAGVFYVHESQKYGNFKESPSGRYLEEIGVNHYTDLAWEQTMVYTHTVVVWSNENLHVYFAEAKRILEPYQKLATDLLQVLGYSFRRFAKTVYSFIIETKPKVVTWLDENIPGLIERTLKYYESMKEVTVHYGVQAYDFSKERAFFAAEWAKTNIFVGKLSPENLQRLTLDAVNTTQQYVKYGYQWIVDQVNSASAQ